MPSIKDVAKLAGVSSATVSRVLANKPHVRPELRQRVMAVVEEIGYRPNRIASSLRKQSSSVIGLLISDIRNPFFTTMARAIEDVANEHEMNIFLCNTDENPTKEGQYLHSLIDQHVAGIIISPATQSDENIRTVLNSKIPLVAIDRRVDGSVIDTVLSDNVQAAQRLTEHLFDQGYRRIGAIIGLQGSSTGDERMHGFKLAHQKRGIALDPTLAQFAHPGEKGAGECARELLAMDQPPEAIITGNSLLTLGTLDAIHEAGLSVPDDLALAGFDETNWMPHLGPGITVISQPTYEMGQSAATLLFSRMKDPHRSPREVVLKGRLIVRSSTTQTSG